LKRAWKLIASPVEPSHVISATVCAKAGADATIINHGAQAVGGLVGGKYGTNRFTAGIIALLAHLRRIVGFKFSGLIVCFKISLNPKPAHLPSLITTILPDQRYIVFSVTGDRTGGTTGTAIQVNDHPPFVGIVVNGCWIARDFCGFCDGFRHRVIKTLLVLAIHRIKPLLGVMLFSVILVAFYTAAHGHHLHKSPLFLTAVTKACFIFNIGCFNIFTILSVHGDHISLFTRRFDAYAFPRKDKIS